MAADTLFGSVVAGRDPNSPALIVGSGGPSYTRSQVHDLAVQVARTLRASGVGPGDVVTLVDTNTVDFVVAFLGVTYSRAVVAPLNQNYTADEFKFYMEDAGSSLLLTGPSGNAAAEAAGMVPCLSVGVSNEDGAPSLAVALRAGSFTLTTAEAGAALEDPPRPEDEALFLHTSGTTSRPKGVPLTHANLASSLANIVATYEFTPEDVSLLVMPLFHVHGLMAGLMAPLSAGASVVLPAAGRFSAGTFWADASAYKVTFYTAVPTMHQILVSRADSDYPKDNPPPLRVIRSCSASLAPATLEQVEKAFKAPVLEAYAMTEASHQMTSNPLPKYGPRKPGTVGKAQGGVKVAILDDQCKLLPAGKIGEVCIQGSNVTAGYRNNPKANEEAFAGGWFHTGDQGFLDEDGYVTLTGRLKELINRGGEKISPLEVDATLLAHPWVAQAASFGVADAKYGEAVAAVVVLNAAGKKAQEEGQGIEESIKQHCAVKLAAFKAPVYMYLDDEIPKGATGKIQRRLLADIYFNKKGDDASNASAQAAAPLPSDGFFLVARALARLGVRHMFGVIGIPVTQLASAAQACGIRFISCRNEQAAGYAASAAGFLTGVPGVLLTVSGPGVVHGLAGVSNAKANGWPMIMLSGSARSDELGKGSFQELDQMAAVQPYVKKAVAVSSVADIPAGVAQAFHAALEGSPGPTYVDLPADVLLNAIGGEEAAAAVASIPERPQKQLVSAPDADVKAAADIIRSASNPLVVIGNGAVSVSGERSVPKLIESWNIPFISKSMARGVVPDNHPLGANSARSKALAGADVVLVLGASLDWQLHFGEPPKWASNPKFILVGNTIAERDADVAAATLHGDVGTIAEQLLAQVPGRLACEPWCEALAAKANAAEAKMEQTLQQEKFPLNYETTLRVLRDEIRAASPAPVVVSEGANTMDQARRILGPVIDARTRLDAGAWGTMGVGPGYALAAAVTRSDRCTVAVEGDSAFGFSAMEVETACRYKLPITFVVFNNGGIYGGDRREAALKELAQAGLEAAGYGGDPEPTAFVPHARYELLAEAFGGAGVCVEDAAGLKAAFKEALETRRTTVINVQIDPFAGVESGNVHAFNTVSKES